MTLRGVVKLDIDPDGNLKEFLALFEKYQEAVKQMPQDWAATGQSVDPLAKQFAFMTSALLAQQELFHKMNKETEENEKKTSRIGRAWSAVSRHTKDTWHHVESITKNLVKWGSIGGGLVGVGGLWGLDHLVNAGSALRTQAMGANASPAQVLAARVNWGQFFDAQGALGNIAGLQQQRGGQVPFNVLGIRGAYNEDPLSALNESALAVHRLYGQTPANMRKDMPWYQQALRIFGSDDAMRTIGNMSDKEIAQHYGQAQKDAAGGFGLGQGTLKAAQDVTIAFEKVSTTLEYTFLAALHPILDELPKLSSALGDVVTKFLSSDGFKHGVDVVADGLEHFSDWLDKGGVDTIVTDIGAMATAIGNFVTWIRGMFSSSSNGSATSVRPAWPTNAALFWDQWHWLSQRVPGSPGTFLETHPGTVSASRGDGMPVIAGQLADSGLPKEAQAYLYAVAAGESGAYADPFGALAGGGKFDPSGGWPKWAGIPHPPYGTSHGAGAWQDEYESANWIAAHGYGADPQGQIKGNWAWASQVYSSATDGRDFSADLKSGHLDPRGMSKLGGQWARGASAVDNADYQKYLASRSGFLGRESDAYGEVLHRRAVGGLGSAAGGASYANVKVGVTLTNNTGQNTGLSVSQMGAGPQ